jgi:hypothetical protein
MKRRRIFALVLLGAGLALWFFLSRGGPSDERFELHVGPAAAKVTEIDLHFQRDGVMERDLVLHFDGGAPDPIVRTLRLKKGKYDLGMRVVLSDGKEVHLSREYQTGIGEVVDLDLK